MANYRDFEMLNNAIQNLGEGALKRRQLDEQNRREMERMAMEREIRGAQMKLSQQAQANSQYNADRAASARAESERMKIINDGILRDLLSVNHLDGVESVIFERPL